MDGKREQRTEFAAEVEKRKYQKNTGFGAKERIQGCRGGGPEAEGNEWGNGLR